MGKSAKKSKQSAQRKNVTLNQIVLTADDAVFGKVVKKLGNGQFRILTTDGEGRGVEVSATTPGKSIVRADIDDMIIVGTNESAKRISYEVLGVLDKKTIQALRLANRLHASLFSEEDEIGEDIFDRSGDIVKQEETVKPKMDKANKPVKADKVILDDDSDVDVDNI